MIVEPLVVAAPAPTNELSPLRLLDAPPAIVLPAVAPPSIPPTLGKPLTPGADGAEVPANVELAANAEIGDDEGGPSGPGDDGGV